MKIYTKSGDNGTTNLVGGKRVRKDDIRVEAYGTVDEANSFLGIVISLLKNEEKKAFTIVDRYNQRQELVELINSLLEVQRTLFGVGAELSTPNTQKVVWEIKENHIEFLEKKIDLWENTLEPITQFILPSGTLASTYLHTCRNIVRRVERIAVSIEKINPLVLRYLNRLSDFFFVAARWTNFLYKEKEQLFDWKYD